MEINPNACVRIYGLRNYGISLLCSKQWQVYCNKDSIDHNSSYCILSKYEKALSLGKNVTYTINIIKYFINIWFYFRSGSRIIEGGVSRFRLVNSLVKSLGKDRMLWTGGV